jgi:UrcA family protein
MIRLFTAAAAALTLASAAVPAIVHAEPIWRVGQGYVVRYQDLDLSTAQGRRALLARVERAAAQGCRGGYMLTREERACREQAVATAMASANSPARSALRMAMSERASTDYASR